MIFSVEAAPAPDVLNVCVSAVSGAFLKAQKFRMKSKQELEGRFKIPAPKVPGNGAVAGTKCCN